MRAHMNPHSNDSSEIGVFDAARYFSGYELHGSFSKIHSIVDTESILTALDLPKSESNLVLQKDNQKKLSKAKKPTSPSVRLSTLFSFLFHRSNSKRNKQKQLLESSSVPSTPKSYPLSPKIYKSLMDYNSQYNDGFSGELWRDKRLDGIRVVGKRWVLNNYANDGGHLRKALLSEKRLCECKKKNEEDDGRTSDASSDLFELENCK